MGDMGEGALHREDEVTVKQIIKIWLWAPLGVRHQDQWSTDRRSQYNLKLNLRHTANYRPVLSSERAPYIINKESNCHSNKCNIWSLAPKGALHQEKLADWPSVVIWLRLILSTSSDILNSYTTQSLKRSLSFSHVTKFLYIVEPSSVLLQAGKTELPSMQSSVPLVT
jgi:hypothetical protein